MIYMENNFMNPPESTYAQPIEDDYPVEQKLTRGDIIINNILTEIALKTDMEKEQWISWLKFEVGLTDEDIYHLKKVGCFPEPMC